MVSLYLSDPAVDIKWLQGLGNLKGLVCKLREQDQTLTKKISDYYNYILNFAVYRTMIKTKNTYKEVDHTPLYCLSSNTGYRGLSKQQHSVKKHKKFT